MNELDGEGILKTTSFGYDGKGQLKITKKEKRSINILCRGAAMRYFLTRLYDFTNTPKTALIKVKDPKEYYQKLVLNNNFGFSVQKGKMVDFQHDAARALDWCSSHSCIIMLKTETKDPRSLV